MNSYIETTQSKYINPSEPTDTQEEVKEETKTPVIIKQKKITPHGGIIPENIPVLEKICEIDIEIKVVRNVYKRVKYSKCCTCM